MRFSSYKVLQQSANIRLPLHRGNVNGHGYMTIDMTAVIQRFLASDVFSLSFYKALFRSRLCWRITVVVFISILLIEAAILFFSARNFERDRLNDVEHQGVATIEALFQTNPDMDNPYAMLERANMLVKNSAVKGGAVYTDDGFLFVGFGESPDIVLGTVSEAESMGRYRSPDGSRYDVIWRPRHLGKPYTVVARLDTTKVGPAVTAFIWRVVGLVFLISAFVTLVTMIILGKTVLYPILNLRNSLIAAGEDPTVPERHHIPVIRDDELGDVLATFNGMTSRLADGIQEIHQHREALVRANEGLEGEVSRRTVELTELNKVLRREITDRKEAEKEIQRLAKFPEENPNPVLRISMDACLLYANGQSQELIDYWKIAIGDRLPSPWSEVVENVCETNVSAEQEIEFHDKTYSLIFHFEPEAGYVNIYGRDITERKRAEERIRHLANHDDLTGLPNRALFHDRLQQVLRNERRKRGNDKSLGAVHLVDLDHFKDVNDTLGHPVGDALLQAIAGRLKDCVRETDTVARLGGDEFAIIQSGLNDADGVATLAHKATHALAEPFEIDGHSIHSSTSIGVTVFPDDASDAAQILRNADMALYRAKGEGRGKYCFYTEEMNQDVQRRRTIERDMRRAIEEDEFVLYYQPKFNVQENRISGMEALIRWQHPEHGFLSPAEFIPIAEKSKLIVPIGEWALRRACAQNKSLLEKGLQPVKTAVNLSAVQLRDKQLPRLVQDVLDENRLDPRYLELEITENVAMDDAEATIATFRELTDLGVSLAIDDFGTGYSSLSYLKSFPVQRVKIDKAFVDDIGTDLNPGAIARAVTTLGHSFGMEVTAEGVETEDQLEILKALGCEEIQGYLISRPLPMDDLVSYLQKQELAGLLDTQAAVQKLKFYAQS